MWALTALGLGLLLAGNWTLPLIDRDEPRFAEASREMRQRGDYVLPRFNGDYRFDKPPLIYWCQAAAFAVMGENEFAARLPSALFATGTGASAAVLGEEIGKCAGGVLCRCDLRDVLAGPGPRAAGGGGYADGVFFRGGGVERMGN